MHVIAWLGQWGGLGLVRRCGRAVGAVHYAVDIARRRDLARQLARALGDADAKGSRRLLRQAYRINDAAALEIIAMYCRSFSPDELRRHCAVDDLKQLRSALGDGRGVILLGMHMGNGMLMTARLAAEGFPVSVVYRESHKMPSGFFERIGAHHGTEGIHVQDPASAYRLMRRALGQGRILYVLMDQATRESGISVSFLGKSLVMPAGPAELARRTGAPVMAALLVDATPVWRFRIAQPLGAAAGEAATAAELASGFSRLMEEHIREYPHLWSWHHRRWRRFPFEAAPIEH
jgi:phosphatidylinositol dimannoside acyltransferase